jgi:hypothetical protein
MSVEDQVEVATRDYHAAVLSPTAVCWIDKQNHKRCKITQQATVCAILL